MLVSYCTTIQFLYDVVLVYLFVYTYKIDEPPQKIPDFLWKKWEQPVSTPVFVYRPTFSSFFLFNFIDLFLEHLDSGLCVCDLNSVYYTVL